MAFDHFRHPVLFQTIKIKNIMKNLKKLSKVKMRKINAGLRWTDDRCGGVIDLRAGAPPRIIQEISNWWCSNFG